MKKLVIGLVVAFLIIGLVALFSVIQLGNPYVMEDGNIVVTAPDLDLAERTSGGVLKARVTLEKENHSRRPCMPTAAPV
jgi:hypothetical protein